MTRRAVERLKPERLKPWERQRADGAIVVQLWKVAAMKREQARAMAAYDLAVRRTMVQGI
jgi:hypothetical protein